MLDTGYWIKKLDQPRKSGVYDPLQQVSFSLIQSSILPITPPLHYFITPILSPAKIHKNVKM
jgi:hypothetical protein